MLVRDLAKEARQSSYIFRNAIKPGWNTNGLLNSVDGFASATDSFADNLQSGTSANDVRATTLALRRQLNDISQQVQKTVFNVRVRQAWQETIQAYNRLAEAVGVAEGGSIGSPPPTNPTPSPGGRFPPEVFNAIDRGIAACNRLHTGFGPYTYYH